MRYQTSIKATIPNGAALSNAINLPQDTAVVGVVMPAGWTAANLTFQMSPDGGATWREVTKVDGTAYQLTVAGGQFVLVPPADLYGIPYNSQFRVRSGMSGTPVNQAADRVLEIVLSGDRC